MEAWFAAAKIFGGIILTTLVNKLFSIFRIRQLYLSYDDILESIDPDARGYTTSIKVYNRGKDKEKAVQIIFPHTTLCQVLSSDYPGVKTEGNSLSIDRLLPGQTLSLNIFLAGPERPNAKSKPYIKSEDSNGKAFSSRGNVPPSLGPVVWAISIFTTILFSVIYLISTHEDPFILYFRLINPQFTNQGLEPNFAISEKLVSLRTNRNDPYPITVLPPKYEANRVILSFEVYNPTTNNINLTISYTSKNQNFWDDLRALNRLGTGPGYSETSAALWHKYGYKYYPDTANLTIYPKQKTVVKITRPIIETTQIENFDISFSFEGTLENKEPFSDTYKFYASNSELKSGLLKHIETVKNGQTK